MYRTIYDDLSRWKESPWRKPLIVRGVRQCGKTYALTTFGKERYGNVAYFNFEDTPDLASVFEHDLDPKRIIRDLCVMYNLDINEETLIIFDEIQYCNAALTSLKYFCENAPEYHVACAGSLLGVMLSRPMSFPVGKVDMVTMRPMSFPEFLRASGEGGLYERIRESEPGTPLSDAFLNRLDRRYREYCFVGGMPEPVGRWLNGAVPDEIRRIQRNILASYEADFVKHAPPKDIQKLNRIWESIPEQLSRENRKFLFGHAVDGARAKDLEDALQWLMDAGLVFKVNLISRPSIPLSAYADRSSFKLYCSDVGLLGAMARIPASSIMSDDERYREFKGGMTENYVLNELVAFTDDVPYYWRSGNKAEVDFVHLIKDSIVPIEVKSGPFKRARSLGMYMDLYGPDAAFIISRDGMKAGRAVTLPHSLVWNIPAYVKDQDIPR